MKDTVLSGKSLEIVNAAYRKLKSIQAQKNEPIAVVGMGCRFPKSNDINAYWQILFDNVDSMSRTPLDRYDIDLYSSGNFNDLIKTPYGGYVDNVYDFDARFFDLSPKEALAMDPQQRLLLEVVVEALENANQPIDKLSKVNTSVYIGISSFDYGVRLQSNEDLIDSYLGTGTLLSPAAGRISYFLNLTGPSMVIDTACSSSLVAVHQALMSLRIRESDISIVGGVGLLLEPNLHICFSKANMLSPDGKCKTFDDSANGYVRGEGCGVIILKRLSDAIKNRDNIQAIIVGSAVNQDGASGGLTIPSGPSQEKVIKQALFTSNIKPEDVDYVEAHGTGTSLGDPIEINALGEVFRNRIEPLKVGSVKTNIGHLEACSGLASLIKVILGLQHNLIPASLHFNKPNSRIAWQDLPIEVVNKNTPWPKNDKKRIAGISSFGFSGTNAHIIVSDSPKEETVTVIKEQPTQTYGGVLTISAKNRVSLLANAKSIKAFLEISSDSIYDICFTSNVGRTHYKDRLAFITESKEETLDKLKRAINHLEKNERDTSGFFISYNMQETSAQVALLFGGMKGITKNTSIHIYKYFHNHPYFYSILIKCKDILVSNNWITEDDWNNWLEQKDVKDVVFNLVTLSTHYAVAKLINYIGIKFRIVFGSKMGEYIAAGIAGVFSLEDMLFLVKNAIKKEEDFSILLKKVRLKTPTSLEFRGSSSNPYTVSSYDYWEFHFGQLDATEKEIVKDKYDCTLTIGYSPVKDDDEKNFTVIGIDINSNVYNFLPNILSYFYSQGTDLIWDRYHQQTYNRKINLPTYAWDKNKYMIARNNNKENNGYSIVKNKKVSALTGVVTFECKISLEELKYIKDHEIFGKVVFPESTYLEMLIEASKLLFNDDKYLVIENVILLQPYIFLDKDFVKMQLVCTPKNTQTYDVDLISINDSSDKAEIHVKGNIIQVKDRLDIDTNEADFLKLKSSFMLEPEINIESYYQDFYNTGVNYGPSFKSINKAYLLSDKSAVLGLIDSKINIGKCCLNPLIIDGCLQLISAFLNQVNGENTYFIMSIDSIEYYAHKTDQIWCHITKYKDSKFPIFNLKLFNNNGDIVAKINNLQVNYGNKSALLLNKTKDWFSVISWNESVSNLTNIKEADGTWLILSDKDILVNEIQDYLKSNGKKYIDIKSDNYEDILRKINGPIDGVIFAKGATIELDNNINEISLRLCLELLDLVHLLKGSDTRLCVITQNVHNDNQVNPQQSVLWGMGRVILLERPELNPIFIDYDYVFNGLGKSVLLDILYSKGENQLLYRNKVRYVARLKYENIVQSKETYNLDPNSAYLVTGAFGALGIKVSELLVERGAKHLVLVSRQGAVTEYAKHIVESFKKKGVVINELKLDISQNKIEQLNIPLKGIVHTAGILEDRLLYNQTKSSFEKVLAPKVQGTWNLHQLTKDKNLDFFVCFSSMTSVIGAVGQANYAAANYFMDIFCRYRRSKGLPAISISWGPWAGAGMGAKEELIKHWSSIGIGTINLDEGVLIFEKLLNTSYPHIGVMPTNWNKYPDSNSFFDMLKNSEGKEKESAILLELRKAEPNQRRKMLITFIESEICEILGYEKGKQSFEEDQGFFELGMNSLTAIEFKSKLQDALDCQLSSTLTFDYPTIAKLVNYLDSLIVSVEDEEENISKTEETHEEDDIIKKLSEQLGL